MSLLTPERVPVKVYRWDDAGAPALDKTAGCVAAIFKACLVTGYGTKEPAGWTMPFEDAVSGVKALRPEVGPHTDFYLRLSEDDGKQVVPQVYLNMTDANTGDLKLQCAKPFKYAKGATSGKWILIASPRGVWFFNEQSYSGNIGMTGSYFFCGDTSASSAGDKLVYLQHTGGTYEDGDFANMMGYKINTASPSNNESSYLQAKTLNSQGVVVALNLFCVANGFTSYTTENYTMQPILTREKRLYTLPGLFLPLSGAIDSNFVTKQINQNLRATNIVVFSASGNGATNTYISTDEWVY